jgi:hypothetical protein
MTSQGSVVILDSSDKVLSILILSFFLFFFFAVLGLELKASHLLGSCSTTGATTLPALYFDNFTEMTQTLYAHMNKIKIKKKKENFTTKKVGIARHQWLIPIILATWEDKIKDQGSRPAQANSS